MMDANATNGAARLGRMVYVRFRNSLRGELLRRALPNYLGAVLHDWARQSSCANGNFVQLVDGGGMVVLCG